MSTVSRSRGRLTRSRSDRMIGGVCAGLARYFEVDPVIVRVLFVVMALAQGAGILLYLVLLIVIPEEDVNAQPATAAAPRAEPPAELRRRRGAWGGALLAALGVYLLVVNLGFMWWWDWKFGGPAVLILAGLALVIWRLR